jgi:hypothetical protein
LWSPAWNKEKAVFFFPFERNAIFVSNQITVSFARQQIDISLFQGIEMKSFQMLL